MLRHLWILEYIETEFIELFAKDVKTDCTDGWVVIEEFHMKPFEIPLFQGILFNMTGI